MRLAYYPGSGLMASTFRVMDTGGGRMSAQVPAMSRGIRNQARMCTSAVTPRGRHDAPRIKTTAARWKDPR